MFIVRMGFIIFSKLALKAQNIILKNDCGMKPSFAKKNTLIKMQIIFLVNISTVVELLFIGIIFN